MNDTNRPISPHLQIYRLPLTAKLSISHRITGVLLSLGLLLFTVSLTQISAGAEGFAAMQQALNNIPVRILLALMLYALFFHWCHGIRHLIMDAGKSLEKRTMDRYALVEIALSIVMTAVAVVII
ncbi:MAG: succinate dehydrogenase, cytochrome b556 subunit [Gammaproteobacteria bacterium]